MARLERPQQKSSNPATKFLSWKSNDKSFEYFDKEKAEKVNVSLPFKFLFLEHYHTIKGWHNASESGVYSNEVYSIGSEELSVKAFKGGEIANGLYKDTKSAIIGAGGKYHRSVYVMLEDGSISNLSFKGSAVSSYSDFYGDNNHLLDNQWILVEDSTEGKKGSITYSTPNFTLGAVISKADNTKANEAAKTLQNYINTYNSRELEVVAEIVSDDVPF